MSPPAKEGIGLAEKRYYWIQLKEGFFKQKEIKKLRKIAGGDTYTVIYLKMLLAAVKQGNKLFFEGVEDTFPEELALELDEDTENVKVTLAFLERQGLIKVMGVDEFLLLQCEEMVGSESESAARVRRYREKKALQCNTDVTPLLQECNTEKDIDIEKEKEIDKNSCPEQDSGTQPKVEEEPAAVDGLMVEKEPAHAEIFIELPLVDGTMYPITTAYVSELQSLYPAVDVKQAFRSMRGWLDSHSKNRKTPRGIKRFITGWIQRDQDKAPRREKQGNDNTRTKNSFHNFHQRTYDYEALERQLLQKGGAHGP